MTDKPKSIDDWLDTIDEAMRDETNIPRRQYVAGRLYDIAAPYIETPTATVIAGPWPTNTPNGAA